MKCPRCNTVIEEKSLPDRSLKYECDQCGWGVSGTGQEEDTGRSTFFWVKLILFWILALVILAGPYIGLRYAAAYFADIMGAPGGEGAARFVRGLNIHYAWIMAAYLVVCHFITPEYDIENMGIFGSGRYANPAITGEHYYNRIMYSLASFMIPGNVVLATFAATWRLAFR